MQALGVVDVVDEAGQIRLPRTGPPCNGLPGRRGSSADATLSRRNRAIRWASAEPSPARSLRARSVSSIRQTKVAFHRVEAPGALLAAPDAIDDSVGEVGVLEILEMLLDRLPNIERGWPPCARRQRSTAGVGFLGQADSSLLVHDAPSVGSYGIHVHRLTAESHDDCVPARSLRADAGLIAEIRGPTVIGRLRPPARFCPDLR